ncbi:phytanoyl-CoA dioxygenase family protein [Streptomyces californicus]|uniref:phytanoyl-CoA dioxygenase family protein n=1 Tax=Streptomyces californicus TaxID=67351 RepID=UPI00296F5C65|nr:phytanoyl-CoA dioxygenase family protein [Streptomyces californicus]MDW4901632.1 phytanoyl-CoA dioxygenase family protein [Streptomyces californicus]
MTLTSAGPVLLAQEEVDSFWRDGYLLIRGVLTKKEAKYFAGLILDLLPRDLSIPEHWEAFDSRFKPFSAPGNQTFDGPEFIPLYQNERLYHVMAQLLRSPRLLVRDGSVAITMRNDTPHDSELSQPLHIDPAVPEDVDEFLFTPEEVEIGGCYYFTDVEPGGGALHIVPGGHRIVEEEARAVPHGRQLHDKWRTIPHLKSVEVTGEAGDFVLTHHLLPHGASHNRRPAARVAQFFRYARDDQPWSVGSRPGDRPADRYYNDTQTAAMTPLGRKLLGVDPW